MNAWVCQFCQTPAKFGTCYCKDDCGHWDCPHQTRDRKVDVPVLISPRCDSETEGVSA